MREHWLELRIPPPLVGLLLAAAAWWLASWGPALNGFSSLKVGLIALFVAVGLSIDLLGLIAFLRRRTTVNPLNPRNSTVLVTGGVYRFTRNPMYLGMACLLVAWAVWLSAGLSLLAPVLFVFYISRFQIQPEERVLTELFGQPYTDYTRRVRRWI